MKRYIVGLLLLSAVLLSGCDALEAKRLNAEAAAARARASEITALYNGRVVKTEAETAQIIAKQQAEEEERESLLAAEVQRSLLRQAELDRQAARRANDLALLAIVGAPLALAGAVAGVVVFLAWRKRQRQRRVLLYRQICQLQRQRRLKPGMTQGDINAILSGAAQLAWFVAPVAELPSGGKS
uniref:Putative terminase n=1 Tax=viral metagenome TaxID=1070528 RepID=A0A6M3K692_9ZZZZ